MGRGRIRRGYSLEVIFEEDPDFCSHLDSLDTVAIRFGVKETDDTISVDSLVEEYRIRFQGQADKEHVFRSLDGIWDVRDMDSCFVEWDEFCVDGKMAPGGSVNCEFDPHKPAKLEGDVEIPPSGRRSRVSRRQIVEASWVFDSDDNDSSGSNNDNDNTEMTEAESKTCPTEPEIKPILATDNTRPTQMFQPSMNLLPIDIRLDPNSFDTDNRSSGATQLGPSPALFGNVNNFCRVVDSTEKDTLDSYVSTRTDDTETNVYTFADSDHFDTASVASTAYDSSTSSSSSTGSVCTVNGGNGSSKIIPINITNGSSNELESKFKTNLSVELHSRFAAVMKEKSGPKLSELGTTDVKKVRALFETSGSGSRKSSLGEESTSSTSSASSSQRIYSRNPASPTNTNSNGVVGGVHKKLKQLGSHNSNQQQHQAVGKVLRSAYSQFNLSSAGASGGPLDFAELLVNDRVVIEDSPDLFQTLRNSRHKEKGQKDCGFSTLRRSRSMGTGLAAIEASLSPSEKLHLRTSKTNILAEEMPAPDTVKNVSKIFEQILKSRVSQSEVNPQGSSAGCSFSIVKKSLSSVKSNPSSKIYRSESMRDDFPSSSGSTSLMACRRFGKPILMNESGVPFTTDNSSDSSSPLHILSGEISPRKSTQIGTWKGHATVERQHSEPIKFSPKINFPVRPKHVEEFDHQHPTLAEESLSLLSSFNDSDEEPPKFVSPEILQRIRSCGSTTTYFGGQVIAESGRSRRQLPVSRRHTLMDFKEFNPAESDFCSNSSRSNTSCSNFSSRTTPAATPTPNQSRSSLSPSSRYELSSEEYFTPPPIPTPIHENLCMNGFISIENDKVLVPRPKLLPRRISPDLEDVFSFGASTIDTTPRIISVLPKSPSSSPTKSASPVGSIIEGRGTPEGCEGQENKCILWSNEIFVEDEGKYPHLQDRNNNVLEINGKIANHQGVLGQHNATQDSEGAWF